MSPRSMRELSSPEGGEEDVIITEYPWRVASFLVEQEESLEEPRAGQPITNGRTAAMNRRPPE